MEAVAAAPVATLQWRRVLPHLPLAVLVAAYAIRFSLLSVAVHDGFGTPPFDMAIPDQGIWLLSRFHAPFVTVMGRNLFADHNSWILALVVPLYWVYPHTQALLVLQSCLLAAGAVPIYLLARRRLDNTWMATALAAAYLLNPALQNGNLEQFHVEAFTVLFLSMGIYAAVEWKPVLLAVSVVGCVLCKEDTAVLMVPLGIWVFLRRDRRWGSAIAVGSAVWTALSFEVFTRALLGAGSIHTDRVPFGGVGGFLSAIFTKPRQVFDYLTSQGRLFYFWQMGVSVGWAFLLGPSVAAIGFLTFVENELADFGYMHQIQYHYSMPLVPILVAGTVYAISRLGPVSLRVAATGFVTACALIACVFWGLAPFSLNTYPHMSTSSPAVRDANAVIAHLPPDAVVSAWYPYVAHIDHRTRIYMWPTPFSAKYWGLYHQEGQRLSFAGQIQYVLLPTDPAELTPDDTRVLAGIASQYRIVYQVGSVALYERLPGLTPQCGGREASCARRT
ncbi:MAG TPA: DUF2079 domain-containing protein [Acidimicrobiales bacterium]|nr:DUF2079 domain-containing protein [Acidimicrobiales bacterium]